MVEGTIPADIQRWLPLTVVFLAAVLTAWTEWRFRRFFPVAMSAKLPPTTTVSGSAA